MFTHHDLFFSDSRTMSNIKNESVNLIITSPPYPMIKMWDDAFCKMNPNIKKALDKADGDSAFEAMHNELDKTWAESFRVLKEGGFACINIGDATRTLGKRFQLYSNHSRIINSFKKIGFDTLPVVLWRKQTNAPNKFMGSGMLPSGAYVTLEHEYILIFRKGAKRIFKDSEEKLQRQRSSFFWEERNKWFSDIWFDLKGVAQVLNAKGLRDRSAAFPFELSYRLICMYSVQTDVVLDPFIGTGTTLFAALAACRNSIGIEIDKGFHEHIIKTAGESASIFNNRISKRFSDHLEFVSHYQSNKGPLKYVNKNYNFPVMTKQEVEIFLPYLTSVTAQDKNRILAKYSGEPIVKFTREGLKSKYKTQNQNKKQLNISFIDT